MKNTPINPLDFDIDSLNVTREEIAAFCARWNIAKLEIFGSATIGELTDSSDVDLLVEYLPNYQRSLSDQIQIQQDIENIFKRNVDLITKESILVDPNPYFLESVMNSLVTLYEN